MQGKAVLQAMPNKLSQEGIRVEQNRHLIQSSVEVFIFSQIFLLFPVLFSNNLCFKD